MIRPATYGDINAVAELLEWGYGESLYPAYSLFDMKATKRFLMLALNHVGTKSKGALPMLFWVADINGVVCGIMLAAMSRIYQIAPVLLAQEVYWFGRSGVADPKDISALFTRFQQWAEDDPRVIEIKTSSSAVLMPEGKPGYPSWRDMEPFYKRRGFAPSGQVFTKRIKR